uniref:Uncharacterized protein n=1 Tax=Rhizophora mucronata TaxID=61149 RepID=A0A2P2NN60_RHIMU
MHDNSLKHYKSTNRLYIGSNN